MGNEFVSDTRRDNLNDKKSLSAIDADRKSRCGFISGRLLQEGNL